MVPVIEVQNLKKYFPTPHGLLHAVDDVTFTIEKGKTLGVVGESGCGKSTLGRTIIHLHEATAGTVLLNGENVTNLKGKALLSAIPSVDIHHPTKREVLKGEITSPINPKPGCRFAARCPFATEACRQPQKQEEVSKGHFVTCCRIHEL